MHVVNINRYSVLWLVNFTVSPLNLNRRGERDGGRATSFVGCGERVCRLTFPSQPAVVCACDVLVGRVLLVAI